LTGHGGNGGNASVAHDEFAAARFNCFNEVTIVPGAFVRRE